MFCRAGSLYKEIASDHQINCLIGLRPGGKASTEYATFVKEAMANCFGQ